MPAIKKNSVYKPVRVKPFLKWAGGKRQLLNQFITIYPPALKAGTIKNYYEPFAGSGAVFFDIAQRYQVENAFLFDVNEELILTYRVIQSQVSKLVETLFKHQKKYLALDAPGRLAYFYAQRAHFNQQRFDKKYSKDNSKGIERAAQFIFLNRTCYNGLFRVNAAGEFNTPAGDYSNPRICDEENLQSASVLLANAVVKKANFASALKNIKPSSFIYLDPPYRPVSRTASFTAYSKSGFADKQQVQLAELFKQADKKGAALMLSNSDPGDQFFDNLYRGFHIMRVPAKRLINADVSKRGQVNEIVVTNYPVKSK